jgi:hypothetical protein
MHSESQTRWRIGIALALLTTAACEMLTTGSAFTFEFPSEVSLGMLSMVEDVNCFSCGTGRQELGAAMGHVHVRLPASHWYVSLKMPRDARRLMPHLAHPSLAGLGDLDLQGSDVTDDDLRYVAGLHLRSINLSRTQITGSGLRYLKQHSRWTWIDLEGCPRLDVDTLAHFRGWRRATIRLVPYTSTPDRLSEADHRLLAGARRVVCFDRPEDVCGTQIR